ncbi:hypothetical protein T484DRAFT_1921190 [Baffinella frigidus]|nr:hypothetical protein T484DRAFT_1921190 [Cryptophyta sp. CCMP2293]
MRNFVLAAPRLVRDDYVSPVQPRSKSVDDLLPRTHAKAALPGFQRHASAEGSTGWVTQEELLARRHSTKRSRCAFPDFPKLMSSFDCDQNGWGKTASSALRADIHPVLASRFRRRTAAVDCLATHDESSSLAPATWARLLLPPHLFPIETP